MSLPVSKTYAPMEALPARELPAGPEWQYEPKWDGFRCLAFRDGNVSDSRNYLDGLMKNVERQAMRIANNAGAEVTDSFVEFL